MKRFSDLTSLALTLAMGAMLSLSSCVNDNYDDRPDAVETDGNHANVIFTVKTGKSQTRAGNTPWLGTGEESGNDVENTINSLTFAIYTQTNEFVGVSTPVVLEDDKETGIRKYLGQLPVKNGDTDIITKGEKYKVMLFANCNPTEEQLGAPAEITFPRPTPPTHEIPMWGVLNPVEFTLNKEVAQNIGNIDLLRAMAKLEVRLSADLRNRGYSLTGPYIDDANLTGYLLPGSWASANTTKDITPLLAFNEWKEVSGQQITLTHFSTDEYWRAYMPEISNTEGSRPFVRIRVRQNDTEVGQYSLQFADYDSDTGLIIPGSYRDIVRNHIYRYEIRGIGAEASIDLTVDHWTDDNTEEWDYTNTIGINDVDRLSWIENTYASIPENTARLIMLDDYQQAAQCTFRIASPVGSTWTAFLIPANNDTQREDFTFVGEDGVDLTDAERPTGIVEQDGAPVTLRIRPTKPKGAVTREVILRVEVRLGNNDVIVANLLNGKFGEGNNEFTLIQNQQ